MNRLLTEPQFKEAARRVGDAIKADIDRSSLVDEMETIAAAGRASNPSEGSSKEQPDDPRDKRRPAHDVPGAPRRRREVPQACARREP